MKEHSILICKIRGGGLAALAAVTVLLAGTPGAQAQWDNWDDLDDMSPPVPWGHVDSIYEASGGTSPANGYDASGGNYRLTASVSGLPLGQPRTLALVTNDTRYAYSNFYVSADIVAWDQNTVQAFGLVARVSEPGPATTDGYAFGLACGGAVAPGQNYVRILRIENENAKDVLGSGPTGKSVMPIPDLVPGKTYRLVFMGRGTDLEGRLYELPNLTTPVAVVSGNTAGDAIQHTDGWCGLLAFGLNAAAPVDVTFDNYYASQRVPLKITDMVVKDNFNDGNDTAPTMNWMHYDPIYMASQAMGLGLPPQGSWAFPGGAYKISAVASIDPANLGPARVGSIDTAVQTNFRISIDLVSFDSSVNPEMAVGILTRLTDPGPGMTDAHALTFQTNPSEHDIDLIRVKDESPDGPGAENLPVDAQDSMRNLDFTTNTYRLVFSGQGNQLRGLVFKLPETMNPLVDCVAVDNNLPAYTAGVTALFGFDNGGLTGVDVTFDNYSTTPILPQTVSVLVGAAPTGEVTITWPGAGDGIWVLESSPAVGPGAVWTQVTTSTTAGVAGKILYDTATGKNTYTGSAPMASTANTYYRLKQL